MASHAYSWSIIGWRHLTNAQFAYFGQADHAILDEHHPGDTAFRLTVGTVDLDLTITNYHGINEI